MLDSRLERFLYAIAALDVDDLPSPLSRIEVLWNCLITGDTSVVDFAPLSRNEEYLMYILGIYDNLPSPSPLSRGEKLLYKIATGDTDLNDVGQPLSKYEELLQYIVSQGDIGDTDFEYITYILTNEHTTLYNTKELPIKSAILKGNTLVNLTCHGMQITDVSDVNLTEGRLTWTTNADWQRVYFVVNEKPNTKYIIKYQSIHENVEIYYRLDTTNINQAGAERIYNSNSTITTGNTGTFIVSLERATASSDSWIQDFMIIEYQDGMENWDIPYFEGIGSVKMPVLKTVGKNLLPSNMFNAKEVNSSNGVIALSTRHIATDYLIIDNSVDYIFSGITKSCFNFVAYYDNNYKFIGRTSSGSQVTRSIKANTGTVADSSYRGDIIPANCKYIVLTSNSNSTVGGLSQEELFEASKFIQLEEGSVATEYEPYKSNTLTANQDIELCGIGDVKDELDLITGEVTRRIGKVVFDGSEDEAWRDSCTLLDNTIRFTCVGSAENDFKKSSEGICDGFRYIRYDSSDTEHSRVDGSTPYGNFLVWVNKSRLSEYTTKAFKEYLSSNPITLYYIHTTELKETETVDITIKDQDGNDIPKLNTFEDVTHVRIDSEGSIPEIEMEVATKIVEDVEQLATMGLRMNDILSTQESLQQEVDTQSENTDIAMLAMTEIYEQIL